MMTNWSKSSDFYKNIPIFSYSVKSPETPLNDTQCHLLIKTYLNPYQDIERYILAEISLDKIFRKNLKKVYLVINITM